MKQYKVNNILILLILALFQLNVQSQIYEHLIMYGQSLSTGQQSWPPLSITAVSNNYMIGAQVWSNSGNTVTTSLSPLIATVATDVNQNQPKGTGSNSSMLCESPIVSVANHIQLKAPGQYKFIATSCGTGGQAIEKLSKEYYSPTLYQHFTNALNYAYSINNNIHCPALFWLQGESNYINGAINFTATDGLLSGGTFTSDKARYKSLQLTLKNNMQADVMKKYGQSDKPIMFTYQTRDNIVSIANTLEISMAQLELANEYTDIVCAGPIYPCTDRGVHLDPNGYRWYGEMLGKVYYKTKILGQNFRPLQPMKISRTINPKVLNIKFLVPVLPLVFETNLVSKCADYGFQVFVNGSATKVTLTSVVINADAVVLTSATDLIGNIEVIYAGLGTWPNSGKGNLRDSDPYTATSNYIDLDKKVNGVFVYQRDAPTTTLRSPTYEPKASDGSPIYDKPYPLYNFSMAFYYKLPATDSVYYVPNLTPGVAFVNVTGVSLDKTSLTMNLGSTSLITPTINPDNATNQSILWSSSNQAVATVTKGVVTSISPGTAIITAKTVDQLQSATCTVTTTATGISSIAENNTQNLILFPNPGKNYVVAKIILDATQPLKIQISTMNGQVIKELDFGNQPQGLFEQKVGLENINSGIYLLSVKVGINQVIKSFIVHQ